MLRFQSKRVILVGDLRLNRIMRLARKMEMLQLELVEEELELQEVGEIEVEVAVVEVAEEDVEVDQKEEFLDLNWRKSNSQSSKISV
jgi:hypothetical protein